MEHITAKRNRLMTMLWTMLFAVVIFGCALFAGFGYGATAEGGDARAAGKYSLTTVSVSRSDNSWIFTENTPNSSLYRMLSVTVTYTNDSDSTDTVTRVLQVSSDGTAATGESVSYSRSSTNITVAVSMPASDEYNSGYKSVVWSCGTLSSPTTVVNGIVAKYTPSGTQVTTATTPKSLVDNKSISVYQMYADGSENDQPLTGTPSASGNLFPTALTTAIVNGTATYGKEVTVRHGGYETTVRITGIKHVAPTQIMGFSGYLPTQQARSKQLKLIEGEEYGLEVMLRYSTTITVPANVFSADCFTVKDYFDGDGDQVVDSNGNPVLTTAVNSVNLEFKYPNSALKWEEQFDVTVDRIAIHTPMFPSAMNTSKTVISWNDGASVDITGWDFATLHTDTGIAPAPQISLYTVDVAGAETPADMSDDEDGNKVVDDTVDGIITVNFRKAGVVYRIKVTLPENGDFMWDSPYNGQLESKMIVTFDVQVDKGTPTVTLDNIYNTVYGTPNDGGKLTAEIEDSTGTLADMGKLWNFADPTVGAVPSGDDYKDADDEWHYRLDYYKSYTDPDNNTPVPAADLRDDDGKPKTCGTYYAVATTYENSGYYSVSSNPVEFKVTEYIINTTIPDKTFARTEWHIDDFIVPNGGEAQFPYKTKLLDILNVKDSANNAVNANTVYYNADKYTVNVTIKSDAQVNYKLKDDTTNEVKFNIVTNTVANFDFTAAGWTYGASDADPKVTFTTKSSTYYPSLSGTAGVNLGFDLANDFEIKYYKCVRVDKDDAGNDIPVKGDEVTVASASDLVSLEVGGYVIELTAKAGAAIAPHTETAEVAGVTGVDYDKVDYLLPSVCKAFWVTASAIVAPHFDADTEWVLDDEAAAKLLYTYNDKATDGGKPYQLINWIGNDNNTAADGTSNIITLTISYTKFVGGDTVTIYDDTINTAAFVEGVFKVNYAGVYKVTITLNDNYSWERGTEEDPVWHPDIDNEDATIITRTYEYFGYVARQQLTVLTDSDILDGGDSVYNKTAQEKTIDNWNGNALKITDVTVGGLFDGHTPVNKEGDITIPADKSNKFSVTNAGIYTVLVDIADQDNYEWISAEPAEGAEPDDVLRQLELTYTLDRASMTVKWSAGTERFDGTFNKIPNTKYPRFQFNGGETAQSTPAAAVNIYSGDLVVIDGYTLYNIANEEGVDVFGDVISSVTAVGHYRIVVSSISGAAAPNYYLPENDAANITNIATVFEIYAYTLARPELDKNGLTAEIVGSDITVTYRGAGYYLSDFIKNFGQYTLNDVLRLDIEWEGLAGNPLLTDVLWNDDDTQVIPYIITVKPVANYAWATGTADETLTYTITINQKTVVIDWGTTRFETTYGEVNRPEPPKPTISNLEKRNGVEDTVNITLGYYDKDNADVEDITTADADVYTVYAADLDNPNYKIESANDDRSIPFIIKKKALAKPTFAGLSGAEFGGSAITTSGLYSNIATEQGEWKNGTLFTAAVTAKLDKSLFDDADQIGNDDERLVINTADTTKYAFDTATGKLTYYAAGIYTVTFSLTDSANYCWAGDDKETEFDDTDIYTYAWDDGITVNRKEIKAPKLGNQRAMERDNPDQNKSLSVLFTGTLTGADNGVTYGVQYGARDAAGNFGALQDTPLQTQIGQYYVLLSAIDKYNYTWTVEPDGENNSFAKSSYITHQIEGKVYKTEYTIDGGARVYLLYAITATQLDVDLVVNNYTYGDNGFAMGGIAITETTRVVVDYTNNNGEKKAFNYKNHDEHEGEDYHLPEHNDPVYTFYKIVGKNRELVDEADLVEGLPWEAGDYEAEIVITFKSEEEYEPWTDTRSFTVFKREIVLDWAFGEGDDKIIPQDGVFTIEYNGEKQTPTPRITNIPQKSSADINPAEPKLNVTAKAPIGKAVLTDAGTHTIINDDKNTCITFAAGSDNNFELGEYSLDVVIQPKKITLTATEKTHVYGNALLFTASDCLDAATKAQFYSRDGTVVVIQVQDATGKVITDKLDVVYGGEYYLVPRLASNSSTVKSANYVIATASETVPTPITKAALTVLRREITVTVTNTPTSVYSENIAAITYNIDLDGDGVGNPLVDREADVFSIAARDGSGNIIGSLTDVGTYNIVLTISSERGNNYAITFKDATAADGENTITHADYTYEIMPKQIEEGKDGDGNDTIVANALTYNGDDQKFLADSRAVVIGNYPEIDGNAPHWYCVQTDSTYSTDGKTFAEFTESPTVKKVGTYYFVIKVTAANHTDLIKNIEVTVGKATLTVKFDLTIMVGEDDPASIGYLFEQENLRKQGNGWTVEGFMSDADRDLFYSAEDFYGLAGEVKYSVDGYSNTAITTSTHKISFIAKDGDGNDTLTCDNYIFVSDEGTLTVNMVRLTVTINDRTVEYNTKGKIPTVNEPTDNDYTVDMPNSTYAAHTGNSSYVMSEAFDQVFTITTTAHNDKTGTSRTGNVGSYAITGEALSAFAGKYDITFKGGWNETLTANANGTCGKYTIIPAELDVNETIADYSGKYDEKLHGIMVDGKNTVELATVELATASDETAVTVKYGVTTTVGELSESEFNQLDTLSDDPPSFRGVGTYYVHYCLTNSNYTTVLGYRTVTIEQGQNVLSQAFNFDNNSVVLRNEEITKAAWTYGYKVTGGFDPDGANKVTEPEATFKYASGNTFGKIKLTLVYTYNNSEISRWEKEVDTNDADPVADMLAGLFAGDGLNAGDYRLRVAMENTTNYLGFSVDYIFKVDKRALTVVAATPDQIQYGSEVPAFTDASVGLVVNSSKAGATADSIEKALGTAPNYVTAYTQGDNVDDYRVYVSDKADGDIDGTSFTNYTVTYKDATLTVVPREITVTIDDKANTYSLRGKGGVTETVQTLTFAVKEGSIYTAELVGGEDHAVYNNDNQTVIVLKTEAIQNGNTNDVKFDGNGYEISNIVGYTIYAVFYNDTAATNYAISFADCSNKEDDEKTAAIGCGGEVNNAGSYRIDKAEFGVIIKGVHHKVGDDEVKGDVYSGAVNYYVATLDDDPDNGTHINFAYTKKGTDGKYTAINANQVIDVGDYQAIGRSENNNYYAANLTMGFTITQATLKLTANPTSVQYGTTLSGVVATDEAAGGAVATGRFDGFTYVAKSETLLDDTLDNYLIDKTVDYETTGYTAQTPVVGSSCTITPVCASDNNVNIVPVGAKLTVIQRNVTVTMVGWDKDNSGDASKHNGSAWCYYLGTHDATQAALVDSFNKNRESYIYFEDSKVVFGDSGNDRTALGITVSLPSGVNVGEHDFGYTAADNTNYSVTFANETAPKFSVQKAKLTLYAFSNMMTGEYTYTYGQTIDTLVNTDKYKVEVGDLSYSVDGMQNGEKFVNFLGGRNIVFTIVDSNGNAYEAWESNIGTYTVSLMVKEGENKYVPTAATFQNYEIVSVVDSTLNLKQRRIKASTKDQTFGFDGTTYNEGRFGKSHNAVITFTDVFGNDDEQVNSAYRPSYDVSYSTNGTYQAAGAAPTVVGNYKVTVKLNANSNYVFGGGDSSVLDFAVNKLVLDEDNLGWDTVSYSLDNLDDETFTNFIEQYVNDYFRVVRFVYTSSTGVGTQIVAGDKDTVGTYYIVNQMMYVTVGRDIGTYTITFMLKDSATGNLALDSAIANEINVSFAVSQEGVTMTVEMADFTYGDQPSTAIVYVNDSEATDGLTLTYAPVISGDAARLAADSYSNKGLESLTGLTYGTLSSATNFNAGYYVISAAYNYNNIIARRYYVFYVSKRVVQAPSDISNITDTIYNGSAQNVVIGYNTAYMRPELTTTGGSMTAANGIATFTATSVGPYSIRFILIDPANNVWDRDSAEGEFSDDSLGRLTLTWNITKDETANGTNEDPIVVLPQSIDAITYGGAFNPNLVTVKNGYNGNITLFRMPKTDDNLPAVSAAGWTPYNTADRRLDAGDYWVKVVLTDLTGRNFDPKATVGSFRIVPKEITASVSGTMIYGTPLSDTNFKNNITITGLLSGDNATIGDYSYDYVESYANLNAGGDYEIVLATDADDTVIGITAGANYIVKAERGTLTITKRAVTVTIESKSSDYSVTPVLTDVQYTADGLADGEDKSVLGIVFETDATNKSAAGGTYWITIKTYVDTNYELTQHRALYVINPLEIEVELVRQENITYGDSNIEGATAGELKIANTDADEDFVKSDLQLVIRFTGSNGYDSFDAPTTAGTYTATLVGANSNYTLIGTPSIDFVIDKKTVDVSAFYIDSATYTGSDITPVVEVKKQDNQPVYASSVYAMTACAFADAGSHDVTVSLTDPTNYVWSSTSDVAVTLTFVINKANDEQTAELVIAGWRYGCYDFTVNSPSAAVKSGERITYQYSADGKTYTNVIPENGNVGTYYVRVTVAESQNYLAFTGEPVSFDITKFVVTAPSLTVVTEGNGKNDVYTGDNLASDVVGFNPQLMQIAYDGSIQSLGDNVTVFALDAGVYTVSVSLFNAHNYCWSEGDDNNDGTIELTWSVARKKIAKPTHDDSTKIVNGSTLVYIPIGFDSSIMSIENNAYSYGGTFSAKITLKDTKNYEWATGDDTPFTIKWSIVGADTVFVVIITILSVLAAACCALILVQVLLDRHKKRETANTMKAIEDANAHPAAENATEQAAEDNKGGNE